MICNMVSFTTDETNFPYKLLRIDRKASKLCKAFAKHYLLI